MKREFALVICSVLTLAALSSDAALRDSGAKTKASAPLTTASVDQQNVAKARVGENFGRLPLYFIENQGQLDKRVAFYAQGSDKTIYFTSQGLTFALNDKRQSPQDRRPLPLQPAAFMNEPQQSEPQSRYALALDFVNARRGLSPTGGQQTGAVFSYFKGSRDRWHAGLKSFSRVVYENVWPGIDLVIDGTVNRMKQTFIVKPGADPNQIRMSYRGATDLKVNQGGQLEVETPAGGFVDERPVAWQEENGRKVEVLSEYQLEPEGESGVRGYGFRIGEYDRGRELVIDPEMVVYSGFIGGSDDDNGQGIAVDRAGNAYVTGTTSSHDFPVAVGPDTSLNGLSDAFVAKVRVDGTGLDYCGYIGGSGSDNGQGIAVDGIGNAYVTGQTSSPDLPVVVGPDSSFNGFDDAFVAKVKVDGSSLDYCGYVGGSRSDIGRDVAVDSGGNAYITGVTRSPDLPVAEGPGFSLRAGVDAFVAKVKANGTGLDYCGYIGGATGEIGQLTPYEEGNSIAVDSAGNAYITGFSETGDLPVKVGPRLFGSGADAFVAKVRADGTGLDYCGYIGGFSNIDVGRGIAVDGAGHAYITGNTGSFDFPIVVGPNAYSNTFPINGKVFVVKMKTNGSGFEYSGLISGSVGDVGFGIAVDEAGNAYITGQTASPDLPVVGGLGTIYNGNLDTFVAKVRADGTGLIYCGYIGGSGSDFGRGIAVDEAGSAYITGHTFSPDFLSVVGPDLSFNGSTDAFVLKISPSNHPPTADAGGPYSVNEGASTTVSASGNDPDGDPLSYAWDLNNDGTFETSGQSVTLSAASLDGPSSHTIQVQVTDSGGLTATSQSTVNVLNVAPTARFTNISGRLIAGQSATLAFSNQSDPSAADLAAGFKYSYDCTDDGRFELRDGSATSYSCTYKVSGLYIARGRIKDKDGGFTDYTAKVLVLRPPQAISELIAEVKSLVSAGELDKLQGHNLIAKLEAGIEQLNRGHENAAINQLESFVRRLNRLIERGVLAPARGGNLIKAANEIIAA